MPRGARVFKAADTQWVADLQQRPSVNCPSACWEYQQPGPPGFGRDGGNHVASPRFWQLSPEPSHRPRRAIHTVEGVKIPRTIETHAREGRTDTMETQQQRAYTVAEAAEVLRVSQWLVREACRRGQLRSIRLGARIIIPGSAIQGFLAGEAEGKEENGE